MGRTRTVAESTVIAVGPDAVYAAVSDPTRMGNWSPENTGARLRETSGSLSVGSTFVGSNRRGPLRWRTLCTVTAADPGKRFAFTVGAIGATDPVIKMRIAILGVRAGARGRRHEGDPDLVGPACGRCHRRCRLVGVRSASAVGQDIPHT